MTIMKRTKHSAEQIVKKLHEAATALAGGKTVEEVCKNLGIRIGRAHV